MPWFQAKAPPGTVTVYSPVPVRATVARPVPDERYWLTGVSPAADGLAVVTATNPGARTRAVSGCRRLVTLTNSWVPASGLLGNGVHWNHTVTSPPASLVLSIVQIGSMVGPDAPFHTVS